MGESGSSWTEFEKSLPTGGLFCCLPDLPVVTRTDGNLPIQSAGGHRRRLREGQVLSASIVGSIVIVSLLLLGLLIIQEPRVVGG